MNNENHNKFQYVNFFKIGKWFFILIISVSVVSASFFLGRITMQKMLFKQLLQVETLFDILEKSNDQLHNTMIELSDRINRLEIDQLSIRRQLNFLYQEKSMSNVINNPLVWLQLLKLHVDSGAAFNGILKRLPQTSIIQKLVPYSNGILSREMLINLILQEKKSTYQIKSFWNQLWNRLCHIIIITNDHTDDIVRALRMHDDKTVEKLLPTVTYDNCRKEISTFLKVHRLLGILEESLMRQEP